MTVPRWRPVAAVITAQFLSSLADNALLIVAIGLLLERHSPAWMAPALRLFFYLSYVLLAAFAGAVADALPKGRVMLATNVVKLGGCALLLLQVPPLLAYALVGLGAAAYSPAKYGILPELLPPQALMAANGWMEATTVASILLGVALGSRLVDAPIGLAVLGAIYLMATCCTLAIPATAARDRSALAHPQRLLLIFRESLATLWRDPQAHLSLAVTSLFWATSAVLQFITLRWAAQNLGLPLSQAALLQIPVAIGMGVGALAASHWIPLRHALRALPLGLALGVLVLLMVPVHQVPVAACLMLLVGALAGLLLVPMNALLQSRGSQLMRTGQSIAVQNFVESLASLLLLGVYGVLLYAEAPLLPMLAGLGGLLVVAVAALLRVNRAPTPADAAAPAADGRS